MPVRHGFEDASYQRKIRTLGASGPEYKQFGSSKSSTKYLNWGTHFLGGFAPTPAPNSNIPNVYTPTRSGPETTLPHQAPSTAYPERSSSGDSDMATSNRNGAPSTPPLPVISKTGSRQCSGTTKAGTQCKHRVKPDTGVDFNADTEVFCKSHSETRPTLPSRSASQQCSGITSKGPRCLHWVRPDPGESFGTDVKVFCKAHLETRPAPPSPLKARVLQCSGTTKTGTRCGHRVKEDGASNSDAKLFCAQHCKKLVVPVVSKPPSRALPQQCNAMTRTGTRCSHHVKEGTALSDISSNADEEVFCKQHLKVITSSAGFYAKNGEFVQFSTYISGHLQPSTQAALRIEMEKPRTELDESGYIYAYEIRDSNTLDKVHLKVGRTTNLTTRIDNWSKHCPSKEPIVRGWWPGTIRDGSRRLSLLKGRVVAGPKGAWCHRVERLVHLELADLMLYGVYMEEGFGKDGFQSNTGGSNGATTPPKKSVVAPVKKCADCGQTHREIFSFTKIKEGDLKGNEWEKLVKPIIKKWGQFVEDFV